LFPDGAPVQWGIALHHDLLTELPYVGHRQKRLLILRRTHVRIEAGRTHGRVDQSRAEKKANEIGLAHDIAVADEGGNIVAHVRMAKTPWIGRYDPIS